MTEERWRPILGYEGIYEVSDRGRIKSLPRPRVKGGIRKSSLGDRGYRILNLSHSNVDRTHYVHILVARAFIGERPDGMQVRHLDGNRDNNVLVNLAYGTPKQNAQDMLRHGTHVNVRKMECPHGHSYLDVTNIALRNGRRVCLGCARERNRQYKRQTRHERVTCPDCGESLGRYTLTRHRSRKHQQEEAVA